MYVIWIMELQLSVSLWTSLGSVQLQSLSECFCLQVSQVYQTIKISNLTQMITFFDFSVVEKLVVEAVKYNFVQVKVDHLREVVSFGGQVCT